MTIVTKIGDLDVNGATGYVASFLHSNNQPPTSYSVVNREGDSPVITEITPGVYKLSPLEVTIEASSANLKAMKSALFRALDTTGGAKPLVVTDGDGTNERYVMVVAERPEQVGGKGGRSFIVTLAVTDDVRWRSVDPVEHNWTATSSGQTEVIANGGDLDAYPTWTITPQTSKSSQNWEYFRRIRVRWTSPYPAHHYPILITELEGWDTAALVAANKVQTADNIAVTLNGKYVPHWYGNDDGLPSGFDDDGTKIWITLPYIERQTGTLVDSLLAASDQTSVRVVAKSLPSRGVLYFPTTGETISYEGYNGQTIFNIVRGVDATMPGDNDVFDEFEVLPYEIRILYGYNGTVPEEAKDSVYRAYASRTPVMINDYSTNLQWFYGDADGKFREIDSFGVAKTASWYYFGALAGNQYTNAPGSDGVITGFAEPWDAMGFAANYAITGRFEGYFPAGVSYISAIGRRWDKGTSATYPGVPKLRVFDNYASTYHEFWSADEGTPSTTEHESWNYYNTLPYVDGVIPWTRVRFEVTTSSHIQTDIQSLMMVFEYPPVVDFGDEETEYDLSLRLENETTGEYIDVDFPDMTLGETLTIDSARNTVAYSLDGTNRYSTVRRDGVRPRFLRLVPGNNTIKVTEAGLTDVDLSATFEERTYI